MTTSFKLTATRHRKHVIYDHLQRIAWHSWYIFSNILWKVSLCSSRKSVWSSMLSKKQAGNTKINTSLPDCFCTNKDIFGSFERSLFCTLTRDCTDVSPKKRFFRLVFKKVTLFGQVSNDHLSTTYKKSWCRELN